MSASVTPAQQAAMKFIADFQAALHPAVLANTHENGAILALELNKRGWERTVENLVRVVNEILFKDVLVWTIPPKKLTAQKKNENSSSPLSVQTAWKEKLAAEDERIANTKATEAAAAKQKSSEAGYKASRSAIAGYMPFRSGRGGSTIDYKEQSETMVLLADYVNKNEAKGVDGVATLQRVGEYLRKKYESQEKSRERI